MSLEFEIPLVSLLFVTILNIVYFSRQRVGLIENVPYKVILIASLIEVAIDTIIHFMCAILGYDIIANEYYFLLNYLNKILSLLFVIIFSSLFCYTMLITYEKIRNNYKKIVASLIVINTIFFIVMQFTNINLVKVGLVTNVNGATTSLGYAMVGVMLTASLIVTIKNIKKLDRRYLPIFFIFLIMGVLFVLTLAFPGIIIYDLVPVLMCYIMYFTIENPDTKLLEEAHEAKKISDKASEEKSMFLYNITQDIRGIASSINHSADIILKEISSSENIDVNDLDELARSIKLDATKFYTMTNDVYDISALDLQNVKVMNNKYSIKLIIKELVATYKTKIENKNINFRLEVDSNLPDSLYGDSINLKQVISTILDNAYQYTKDGFVELSVNAIIKHDVCRLLIKIEDSGIGIKAEEIEKKINVHRNEQNMGSLFNARRLLTIMGGNLVLTSDFAKGTKVTIVLDQKINDDYKETIVKYEPLYGNKKILIVDDKDSSINLIKKLLVKETNLNLEFCTLAKTALEKIRAKETYDLILIDEDINYINGKEMMKKFINIKNFNIPVVLMSRNVNIQYDEEYKKIGFTNYLIKPVSKDSLMKIIKENAKK